MYSIDTKELKKAMIDADLDNIQKLADKAGVDRNTISYLLNGKTLPSTEVMRKIASALNLPSERAGRIFFATQLAPDVSEE